MTELDELEEIDLRADRSANPGKRMRMSPKNSAAAVERSHARPRWVRQLGAEKAWAPKRKPGVTA